MCTLVLEPVALRRNLAYLFTDPRLVTTVQSIDVVLNAGVRSERAKRVHSLYNIHVSKLLYII